MSQRGRARTLPLPGHPDRVFSVSELTRNIRAVLEDGIGVVVVQGEVTNYKGTAPSSGHTYFSLKDATSEIAIVLYADRTTPSTLEGIQNGVVVQVEGDLTVYEKRGTYQVRALRLHPIGYGALQARFEALKRKLEMEGLFADDRKRALPRYPTRIGIVTSESGAALRDMLRILRARAPYARITVADTRVQGEGASMEIAAALARMNRWGKVEVVIVGRGGGSPQDLWAFNEEPIVRAIVRSSIPVVSAVGHETDITLADLAADLRAATPTHAAQLVVRDHEEIRETLRRMSRDAHQRILRELNIARTRLTGMENHHAIKRPGQRVQEAFQTVDALQESLARGLRGWVTARRGVTRLLEARLQGHAPSRSFAHARERIESCRRSAVVTVARALARRRALVESHARLLVSYDHHNVLERGYALVWSEDGAKLRKRGAELRPGEPIEVQFFDARAGARVTEIVPESAAPTKSGKETP